MGKLSTEHIKLIDNYLTKYNVKYIDVRLELIDHLASEYEDRVQNDIPLEDFLNFKRVFIKNFIEDRQKKIHWSYQRQLWVRFLMFFYKPIYLLASILIFILVYFFVLKFKNEVSLIILFLPVFILQMAGIFSSYSFNRSFRKLQSAKSIVSIMSVPSLFLSFFILIKGFLIDNPLIYIGYFFIAILVNASGLIEILDKKKKVLEKYKSIFNEFI